MLKQGQLGIWKPLYWRTKRESGGEPSCRRRL